MWRHAWHRTGLLQLVSSSMFVCVDDPRPGTASFARIAQRSAEPDEVIDQLKCGEIMHVCKRREKAAN